MSATDPQLLLDGHADFLRRLARGLLGDGHAAEDVLQEARLAALERPPRHAAGLAGWSARVVRRLAGRRLRGESRRAAREARAAHPEALPGADELVAREELLRRVTAAVLALEAPYRRVVLLRHYEGLDARAIAALTGEPLATVRSRLQRAHAKLRERLDAEHGGERGAWSLALVGLLVDRRVLPTASGASGAAMSTGALVMGAKTKLAAGAAVAALVSLGAWRALEVERVEPAAESGAAGAPATALSTPASSVETAPAAPRVEPERAALAPPPAPPRADRAALEVELRFARTGEPAGDCELRLLDWNAPANERQRAARTDAEGRARFAGLRPGAVVVESSRGASASVELSAGQEARVELAIPPGFTVRGRVVDDEGRPVGGARLWLSDYFNHTDGGLVGVARADGSFEVEDVQEARYLGAFADGYAPSHLYYLEDLAESEGADVELELVLNGPGGALRVELRGPDGAPVEGAQVRVLGAAPSPRELPGRITLRSTAPLVGASDADGALELGGLRPPVATIEVLAAGLAPYHGTVEVEAGVTTLARIELLPECVVRGSVARADGSPASGAEVFLAEGEYTPTRPSTRVAADGSFELRALPPGARRLKALDRERGSAVATLTLVAGEVTPWDATLSAGRVLSGAVVDEAGAPLAGWIVQVQQSLAQRWRGQAETDAAGRFRIVDCPTGALELELIERWQDRVPALRRRVAADEDELLLRVGPEARPEGSISGRLLDEADEPLHGTIAAWTPGRIGAPAFPLDSGSFSVERLPAGTYELSVTPEAGPRFWLPRVELRPGEALDLGTLRLEAPASLLLTVAGGAPSQQRAFQAFNVLQLLDGAGGEPLRKPTEFLQAPQADAPLALRPGRYLVLALANEGSASEQVELELRGGEARALDLTPRPGRECELAVEVPEGAPMPAWVELRLVDEAGRAVVAMRLAFAHGRRFDLGAQLAPGRYLLDATADDGRRASGSFQVELPATPGPPQPLVAPLR